MNSVMEFLDIFILNRGAAAYAFLDRFSCIISMLDFTFPLMLKTSIDSFQTVTHAVLRQTVFCCATQDTRDFSSVMTLTVKYGE